MSVMRHLRTRAGIFVGWHDLVLQAVNSPARPGVPGRATPANCIPLHLHLGLALFVSLILAPAKLSAVTLGVSADGRFFTIEGVPTYLNGVSYYAGCGISTPTFVTQD